LGRACADRKRALGRDRYLIVADRAFHVVDVEPQCSAVAGEQEPRQGRSEDYRIAHDHVA